jgi:hypothetical protein
VKKVIAILLLVALISVAIVATVDAQPPGQRKGYYEAPGKDYSTPHDYDLAPGYDSDNYGQDINPADDRSEGNGHSQAINSNNAWPT